MDARHCPRCGSPLTSARRRYCSDACRQASYRQRRNVTTLAFVVDAKAAASLDLLSGMYGMSRSGALRHLLYGWLESQAAQLSAPPPIHEPTAAERSTEQVRMA